MSEWYSFNDQMKEMFGGKVYRLSLSSGCTCPNRDGTLSLGGCIFCSAGGSGDFAADKCDDILSQICTARRLVQGKIGRNTRFAGYMAYFQPFTNTYGDTDKLAALFESAADMPDIVALSVATRPDCIKDDMVSRLKGINASKPVFVELGLQTVHEETASYINRCYRLETFEDAFNRLKAAGLRVVVHVIIGLPGEDAYKTFQTVSYLSGLKYREHHILSGGTVQAGAAGATAGGHIDAVKLQLLYVLEGTRLAKLLPEDFNKLYMGQSNPRGYIVLKDGMLLPQYTLSEYAALIKDLIAILPAGTAVHRVTGDPPRRGLILPQWTTDKKRVLNTIRAQYAASGSRGSITE